MKINFKTVLILLAILSLAFVLRLGPALFKDLWYDEAFTGILLKEDLGTMNQMIFADVHPPLYYWLTNIWSEIFGFGPLGIRSFSLVLGLASVLSIFWIGEKMFSKRVGILAAFITAISPFAVQYSQEARMYALLGLLFLWSFWFFYQGITQNKRSSWIWWGIFSGLVFYTHYLSVFFFAIFYVAYVFYLRIFEKKSWPRAILGKLNFWIGVGVIAVFFLSWIKYFIGHISKGNLGWIEATYLSTIPATLQIFFFGHPPGAGGTPLANGFREISYYRNLTDQISVGLILLLVGTGTLVYSWMKKIRRAEFFLLVFLSLGTLVFLVFLSIFNIKLYVARYFMPAALLVYLLISGMVSEVPKNGRRWAVIFSLIYVILLGFLAPIKVNDSWAKIYEKRIEIVGEDGLVVADNPFEYTTSQYYFGREKVRFFNKGNPDEDFGGWVVVGNENKITDWNSVENLDKMVFVSEHGCDWGEKAPKLEETGKEGKFFVCRVGH